MSEWSTQNTNCPSNLTAKANIYRKEKNFKLNFFSKYTHNHSGFQLGMNFSQVRGMQNLKH